MGMMDGAQSHNPDKVKETLSAAKVSTDADGDVQMGEDASKSSNGNNKQQETIKATVGLWSKKAS